MRLPIRLSPPALHNSPARIPIEGAGASGEASSIGLAQCKRILVIKLDHIGDWILCTPFLQNLRLNAPRAEIDVLVLPRIYDLAAACPYADRVVALDERRTGAFEISAQRWSDAVAFERDYAGGVFDLAVVPRWDADFEGAARIAAGSGARAVIGFSENCTRRKRVINRGDDGFYTHVVEDRTACHEVEHNLNLIKAMNGRVMSRHAAVHVSEADQQAARRWLGRQPGPYSGSLIALAPFASEPKRELPIREFAALAQRIAATTRCSFIVIGGPTHRLRGARLAALLRPEAAVSTAGQLSIRETVALIGLCDVLIGVDSGPVHLAAAAGTPVAVLSCHPAAGSPNHANSPARFAPWASTDRSNVLILQPASGTPPCKDCCTAAGPHCIRGINDTARLLTFVQAALAQIAAAPKAYAAHE
jgi:heptosyltransferase-2